MMMMVHTMIETGAFPCIGTTNDMYLYETADACLLLLTTPFGHSFSIQAWQSRSPKGLLGFLSPDLTADIIQ